MGTQANGGRPRRRPPHRREMILHAAVDAFAHGGYYGTTMADIAAAVGISATALYRHFRNKQQLLGQCLLVGLDDTSSRLDAAFRSDDSGGAVLAELVRVALELRGLPRLWQLEFRNLTAADKTAVLVRAARITRYLRHTIHLRRPELSAADVELLSWCVLSIAVSPSYHRAELPAPAAAQVLDAAVAAVIATEMPEHSAGHPPNRPPRTETGNTALDRALRSERMLAEAARLFSTRGYAAVGIEDIGAAVGVTGPALYHHFSSKAELLDQIVRRQDEWLRLLLARAIAEGRSAEESMRSLMRSFAQLGVDEPDLLAITVSETRHLPGEAVQRYRRVRLDGIAQWARMLQAVRPDLSAPAARVLSRAVTTVVIDAVRNPRFRRRADLVDVLVAIGERIETARGHGRVTAQ
ncbi:TetR/AcrR family transcriptional regulator [Nocardia abscessus]|uniref:TetR/AcrR family transcriptional regulator n=1 Tax=Nocardia abscessus TaxID=120957 RepID=UPI00245383A1|nr:TetR/AcrR family transcriptional regulator [Nocardia abscessus]